MATEKRMISPDAFWDNLDLAPSEWVKASTIKAILDETPTVDAVEVVRCKNCQYWNPRYETMGMCMKHNSIVTFTKPDFYCAFGKGKNDGICKED